MGVVGWFGVVMTLIYVVVIPLLAITAGVAVFRADPDMRDGAARGADSGTPGGLSEWHR